MRKTLQATVLLLFFISTFGSANLSAQFTTPGEGLTLTFSDLVDLSEGVVTQDEDGFFINDELVIAASDKLEILEETLIRVQSGVRIEILGAFESNPLSGMVTFTAADTTELSQNFRGFRFEDADPAIFRNTTVKYGGGIQLIGTFAEFEDCVMRNNGSSNVSNAITFSGSSPVINNCDFVENQRSAIGSGANVQGSPQITNSRFIHNTMDNSNRPQINLGPGAPGDTLRIENNYIEGLNDNAGGIGLSNLLGSGTTVASVRNNTIVNNRYGIAQIGNNISTVIEDNIILDNDIQGNPNLGGSGINFNAGEPTNTTIARRNLISGNLWGVTIQGEAQPSFGTEDNPGGNVFFDNENGGVTYALFNNTPQPINAVGNYWGDNTVEFAESVIFDEDFNPSLGPVSFIPINTLHPEFESFNFLAEENPDLDSDFIGVIDAENAEITFEFPFDVNFSNLIPSASVALGVESDTDLDEPRDFSMPVSYTLSVPHGEEQEWTVIVTQLDPPPTVVQYVHASADPAAELVDVYVNDELVLEAFEYGTATEFILTPVNEELNVVVTVSGTETPVIEKALTLDFDVLYSITVTGVASPEEFAPNPDGADTGLQLLVTEDVRIQSGSESDVEFYILHASTDAPAVDIRANGTLLAEGISYGESTPYLNVSADTYEIDVLVAGTEDIAARFEADLSMLGGGAAQLVAKGFLNPADNQNGPMFSVAAVLPNGEVIGFEGVTGDKPGNEIPAEFALEQNYPNPFNPTTNIRFSIAEQSDVTLEVYNIHGQRVATLVEGNRARGQHTVAFDAQHLASGVYLYRLRAGSEVQTRKMMLVK